MKGKIISTGKIINIIKNEDPDAHYWVNSKTGEKYYKAEIEIINNMEHYRIVETGEGFKIQKRLLWIFWLDCSEPSIEFDHDLCYISDDYFTYYNTFEEAMMAVERLKNIFVHYKGHELMYALYNNIIYWIDTDSYRNGFDITYYDKFSTNIEDVKKEIDNMYQGIEDEKVKKKIKNIYYI